MKILWLVLLLSLGFVQARTIQIVKADHLELRTIAGQELVIMSGDQVELKVDEDTVIAKRIEYNRTQRILLLSGGASYTTKERTLSGEELRMDLGTESLSGQDVIISDAQLTIRGEEVERATGQVRATRGYFTLCARCGYDQNDYAFRAEKLLLYPGDRVVAHQVQLLIRERPVLYLPVMVLPLNEESRQPRLDLESGSVDGYRAELDLPFALGSAALGTTFLRFYEKRPFSVGGGVQLGVYGLTNIDRLSVYGMALPRRNEKAFDIDFRTNIAGRIIHDRAITPPTYRIELNRRDIGSNSKGITSVDMNIQASYPLFSISGQYYNRFADESKKLDGYSPTKTPEIIIDPKPFKVGNAQVDLRLMYGNYRALSNPLSRKARAQGEYISMGRLQEKHTISLNQPLGETASLNLNNSFTGNYYGNGSRTVQLEIAGELKKKWNQTEWSVSQKYYRYEGVSPFAFDALSGRRISAPLKVSVQGQPKDIRFSIGYQKDLLQKTDGEFTFSASTLRAPLTSQFDLLYNTATKELENANYSIALTGKRMSTSVTGGYRGGVAERSLQPMTVKVNVHGEKGSFGVSGTYDFRDKARVPVQLQVDYSMQGNVSLSGYQSFDPHNGRIRGYHRVSWMQYFLSMRHDMPLYSSKGTMSWSVSNSSSSRIYWQMNYGGDYHLEQAAFIRPQLNLSVASTGEKGRFNAGATVAMLGLEQPRAELTSGYMQAAWQAERMALSGRVNYSRTRDRYGNYSDRLVVDPFRFGIALGDSPLGKPNVYLTASVRQTYQWYNGNVQSPQPLSPIIGLTWDRCCWALQSEWDIRQKRFRIAVGLPGQTYSILDKSEKDLQFPFAPFHYTF